MPSTDLIQVPAQGLRPRFRTRNEIAEASVIPYKKRQGRVLMAIVAAQSVASFFTEAVEDSIRARKMEATDEATRYIVGLLADYANPKRLTGETLERPLTLLFDEAVHAPDPDERFERLRTLGDGVL